MIELIIATLEGFFRNPTVMAIGAGVVLAIGAFVKGRLSGAKRERDKQAVADAAARTEGQKIDDAVAGRAPDANRERLGKWSKS